VNAKATKTPPRTKRTTKAAAMRSKSR
jgi:hypothetical protein